jgi:leader peptidase (prepilin peptidase) / N-methyltransferase
LPSISAAAPDLLRALLGFGLGAIVGSFLATVLLRWPQGRGAIGGRSACDACGRTLRPAELVPILSYLVLRGRCRTCGAAIAPTHLGVELAAGLIGAVALAAHPGPLGFVSAVLGWWLLLLGALDAEHQWLPDRLTLPLLQAGWLAAWAGFGPPLEPRLIGAAAGFVALWTIAFGYRRLRGREGLGGGDPKLFGALGAWLGWAQLPFLLLGTGLLGLAAVALRRMRGEAVAATDRLPLGTLLALAAWPIWLLVAPR